MTKEYDSLMKNKTWVLVENKPNQKVVSCKWIFKNKQGVLKSDPIRFQARLVAGGNTQREEINYTKLFSPVIKHTSIRFLMAVVA